MEGETAESGGCKSNENDIASSYFQTKYGSSSSNNSCSAAAVTTKAPPAPPGGNPSSHGNQASSSNGTPKKGWRSASVGLRGAGRSNTATPDRETRSSSATRGGPMFSYLSLVRFHFGSAQNRRFQIYAPTHSFIPDDEDECQ